MIGNKNIYILNFRSLSVLFTIIRNSKTKNKQYIFAADRLMNILTEEALASLVSNKSLVKTPCGIYAGFLQDYSILIIISLNIKNF